MRSRPLFVSAVLIVAVGVLLFAFSGPGARLGLWTFGTGFTLIRWGAYAGIAGALLSVVTFAVGRPRGRASIILVVALLVGVVTAVVPWRWMQRARQVPPIHDVTTDTQDPPAFVDVLPLRETARNSAVYGGDSIAAMQREGYPDLAPLRLAEPPAQAFTRAAAAARAMGWEIVAADSAAGRVEATATTTWFGFKDDVVVRIRPDGDAGSLVDVRSVSRVGGSDVGANAERIRAFLARLSA